MRIIRRLGVLGAVLAVAALAVNTAALAQTSANGTAVEVAQPAQVQRVGALRRLNRGDAIAIGDILRTGRGGQVQLLFGDETRIAMGPDTVLRIDEALFRRNGTASRFAVSALGGVFRFLSGDSPNRAYAIRTPTATMGLRGTAFDFTVGGTDTTDLVVYDGLVRFCGDQRLCATVPGGCRTVRVGRQNAFSQPETLAEKADRLATSFPFLGAQGPLRPGFRTSVDGCSELNTIVLPVEVPLPPSQRGGAVDGGSSGGRSGNPAE